MFEAIRPMDWIKNKYVVSFISIVVMRYGVFYFSTLMTRGVAKNEDLTSTQLRSAREWHKRVVWIRRLSPGVSPRNTLSGSCLNLPTLRKNVNYFETYCLTNSISFSAKSDIWKKNGCFCGFSLTFLHLVQSICQIME